MTMRARFRMLEYLLCLQMVFWGIRAPLAAESPFRLAKGEPRGALSHERMKFPLVVRVGFTADVVGERDRGSSQPQALHLSPPVQARGRWSDPRTYELRLDLRELPPGTEFRCRVPDDLRDRRGRPLVGEREFSFLTPPLKLLAVRQAASTVGGIPAIQLEFSHPVAPEQLERFLSVRAGENVLNLGRIGAPAQGPRGRLRLRSGVATRTPVVELAGAVEATTLTVSIAAGLSSVLGGRPLEEPASLSLAVESVFVPVEARGYWKGEKAFIRIEFSAPVALEHAADNISIDPPVAFTVDRRYGVWVPSSGENALILAGEFQPKTRYRIALGAGLQSADGTRLGTPRVLNVWVPRVAPFLVLEGGGGHLSPSGTMKLRVRSSGLGSCKLSLWRLFDNNLFSYISRSWEEETISELGALLAERTIALAKSEAPATTLVDLRDLLSSGVAHGILLVRLEADYPPDAPEPGDEEERYRRATGLRDEAVIVLSNLGVVGKRGVHDVCLWVTSLDTAEPIAGANVQLLTVKNQLVGEAVTDSRGFACVSGVAARGEQRPALAIVRTANDLTYLDLSRHQLSVAPEVSLRRQLPFLSRGYEAFLTTDRGVYRPGESVHLAGFVRGVDGQPPKGAFFPLELLVLRPDGVKLGPTRLTMTEVGALASVVDIPSAGPTGLWKAVVRLPGDRAGDSADAQLDEDLEGDIRGSQLGRVEFFVEDVMPTRLDVSVEIPEKRFRSAEPLPVRVRASELFGRPAAGRPWSVAILYKAEPFTCPAYADYTFGDPEISLDRTEETLDAFMLDKDGLGQTTVVLHASRAPAAIRAEIQATVRDVGGRAVTKRVERLIDPVPFYLGARIASTGVLPVGKPFECRVVAVHPDGSLARDVLEVSATLYRVVWDSILKRAGEGYTFATSRRLVAMTTQTLALKGGIGQLQWTPPTEGQYALLLTSPACEARTRVEFYASSTTWSEQPWSLEKPENLELVPDKAAYEPGEVARVVVKAPFAGTLFVALEQDRVTSASVSRVASNTCELVIPIEASMAPNVFVSATLVRPVRPAEKWLPHRAFGTVALPVVRVDRRVSVLIDAPALVRPQSSFEAQVAVVDAQTSRSAQGELFVWAVDEGVLALTDFATPDPWMFFYGPRRLGVSTADFYSELMPDLVARAASAPGGGESGAARRLSPVAAERVKPVVLWKGLVRTDASGRARVSFNVPSYAGRLRVMAVAGSGPCFGAGQASVIVRGPIVVEQHMPRFLSPGDEAAAPIVLVNASDAATTVKLEVGASRLVRLSLSDEPNGAENVADAATTVSVQVSLAPGQARSLIVRLLASSQRIGVARVTMDAVSSDFRYFETFELPIRPATVLQRIAGSAVLHPGERKRLELPKIFLAGTTTGTLTISGSRAGQLLGALRYNLTYPYGCSEQTISGAFGLLAARDLPALAEQAAITSEGLALLVAGCVERLSEYQTRSGGIAMWPGQSDAWLWSSLYALHFLLEARRVGYPVPSDAIDNLVSYVRAVAFREMGGSKLTPESARERAYAAYVLAAAGKPPRDQMELMFDKRDSLPIGARALLAGSYLRTGMPEPARILLDEPAEPWQLRETGRTLASPVREAAILLSTLLEIEPQAPRTLSLAERLYAQQRSDGSWGSTQDNAFALWALARFERSLAAQPLSSGLVVEPSGQSRRFRTDCPLVVSLADPLAPPEILAEGPGPVYVSWVVEGLPLAAAQRPDEHALQLTRRYLDRSGENELDPNRLRQGDPVIVELTLRADRPVENVVVVDLLPAGLEIENPRLATAERAASARPEEGESAAIRTEARDDRMIFFCDVTQAHQPRVLRYLCRAVAAGRFAWGPAWAECMYDPELRATTSSGQIRVQPSLGPHEH